MTFLNCLTNLMSDFGEALFTLIWILVISFVALLSLADLVLNYFRGRSEMSAWIAPKSTLPTSSSVTPAKRPMAPSLTPRETPGTPPNPAARASGGDSTSSIPTFQSSTSIPQPSSDQPWRFRFKFGVSRLPKNSPTKGTKS